MRNQEIPIKRKATKTQRQVSAAVPPKLCRFAVIGIRLRAGRRRDPPMKDTAEIAMLRTMLNNVNREYSATLRARGIAERAVKLEGLKLQRLALMSSIAERRGLQGSN